MNENLDPRLSLQSSVMAAIYHIADYKKINLLPPFCSTSLSGKVLTWKTLFYEVCIKLFCEKLVALSEAPE